MSCSGNFWLFRLMTRRIQRTQWTIPVLDKLLNSGKSISTAAKSILNFIKFSSLIKNIVKCGKYSPVNFANFLYFGITHAKALPLCGNNAFSRVIQNYTKFANFTAVFSTFCNILQPQFH